MSVTVFIRRWLLRVLPSGFHRIRHYGLYAECSGKPSVADDVAQWPKLVNDVTFS